MATLIGTRGSASFPVGGIGEASNQKIAWGSYTFTANPPAATVVRKCKVPKNAVVLGGYVQGADLDTGTEEMDFDIGWEANGVESADPDGFGNFGVVTGDAVTGIKPEAGIYYILGGVLFTTGPQKFSEETIISVTVNTDAATGGTGILTVVVWYVLDF